MKIFIKVVIAAVFAFLVMSQNQAFAAIKLPVLISDHMVLQRDVKLKLWGWADPGEKVSIELARKKGKTVAGADGKWLLELPPLKAGGPYTLTVTGNNKIVLTDILIGDVWFCSGQSNMVLNMGRLKEKYPDEVTHDNFPEIRNFFVPTKADVTKVYDDLPPGKWAPAVGDGLLQFGGATYFFAKQLYQKYHVPIGIINSSVGGVPIEAWMSADAFKDFPDDQALIKNFRDSAYMRNLAGQIAVFRKKLNPPAIIDPDRGISGPIKWTDPTYTPKNWHKFWLPGYWADQGVKDLNGIVYFRKEVDVPAAITGMPAKLFLGRIVDADSAFVNGTYVGNTTYQYPPRRYTIPAGVLRPGKNIILVKVISFAGKGGFVPDKNYTLRANGQNIDLRGDWTYQVGQVFQHNDNALSKGPQPIIAQNSPTGLYNTMAAPATNYSIKGFVWYQGEANSNRPKEYAKLLPALIADWRSKWNEGDIPFLYAQLPNFMEVNYLPSESDWAQLRASELMALSVPNTGMAVSIDAGEWNDIHPLDKKDVGERLALWAEHLAYGEKDVVYSGPVYRSYKVESGKIILTFSNTGSGLTVKGDGELYYFAIAGADKKYVWAKAKIDGDKVIVWSDNLPDPVSVRYAWADNPEGANLYNIEGLPASPFETTNDDKPYAKP